MKFSKIFRKILTLLGPTSAEKETGSNYIDIKINVTNAANEAMYKKTVTGPQADLENVVDLDQNLLTDTIDSIK